MGRLAMTAVKEKQNYLQILEHKYNGIKLTMVK